MPEKIINNLPKKYHVKCLLMQFMLYLLQHSTWAFFCLCVWVNTLSYDLSLHRIDQRQQYLCNIAALKHLKWPPLLLSTQSDVAQQTTVNWNADWSSKRPPSPVSNHLIFAFWVVAYRRDNHNITCETLFYGTYM